MTKLTRNLKAQHKEIVEKLDKVRQLGIGSKEAQQLLISAKELLLNHLHKEDAELYPVLRQKAASDETLKRTMNIFAKDMESISKTAIEFFAKYSNGNSGLEFSRDFGRLFTTLGGRISKEENILYKAYENLA